MKNKISKIGISTIVLILMLLGICQIAKYEINNTFEKAQDLKALNTAPGNLMQGEKDPNNYNYNINTGTWEAIYGYTSYGVPYYKDFQIYCMEPGAAITYKYDIRYETAKAEDGKRYTKYRGHASVPHNGKTTPPVYSVIGKYDLPPAAAYIVSDEPIGKWSEKKQNAIWNLRDGVYYNSETGKYEQGDNGIIGSGTDTKHDKTTDYDPEALDYAEYDTLVRNKGLKPEDKTNLSDVTTKVDQDAKEYTIGPFNMTYTNGIYGNIAFSGVSEMTVVGYNSKGDMVRDDIKIEKLILKDMATGLYGNAVAPEYFEPSEDLKVDETKQVYPLPGQEFQIIFKDPNEKLDEDDDDRIAAISIKIKYKYMLSTGKYTKLRGTKYTVRYTHNSHSRKGTCIKVGYLVQTGQQDIMAADAIRSIYEQEFILGEDNPFKIGTTMNLGGHVWEDVPGGKENISDGISSILLEQEDGQDKVLPNVKVTLYTKDGEIAKLLSNPEEEGISEGKILHRVNPTYTDEDGNYLFEGVDSMKQYYVTFEYNGQVYLPTDYLTIGDKQYSSVNDMINVGLYNKEEWKITSKGTEENDEREEYNEKFKEIGSSPLNYKSSNSLDSGYLERRDYNETFSRDQLMGFILDEDGNYYKEDDLALIDGFYKIEDGNIVETDELQEGMISRKIKEFIYENKKYPDEDELKEIYEDVADEALGRSASRKEKAEIWKKLQFIEDCKISSYTKPQEDELDLYPAIKKFIINLPADHEGFETAKEAQEYEYNLANQVLDGKLYTPIYPGQLFINQGLWRRQEANLGLRKDVAYAATRINDETTVYTYDKRSQLTTAERKRLAELKKIYDEDRTNKENYKKYLDYKEEIENKYYWEIQLRMRDYNNYYAMGYTREIYKADYNYRSSLTNKSGKDLELYVTYKITVRNSSTSILSEVTEIVDYYDKDYTYVEDLSWVMYKQNSSNDDDKELMLSKDDYYQTIDKLQFQGNLANRNIAKPIDSEVGTSRYGHDSQQEEMEDHYNSVYVRGLDNKKLESGEEAFVYLTFKVNTDKDNKILLDDDGTYKQNYAEINGYTTYYRDGTKLPNNQTKSDKDAAGLIDINSNPGNLSYEDIEDQDSKYEKNFEDDTDRAKSIKVTVDNDKGRFVRAIKGNVWEDERTQNVSNSVMGDGVRQDGELGVQGVTVKLIEKLANGGEYEWAEVSTDANGNYEFKDMGRDPGGEPYIIPGNYIVRFQYGDKDATLLTNTNKGANATSYNGQDFKSTVYQKDMKNGKELAGYNDQNYDIKKADALGTNLSDAKDVWSRREAVNNYSSNNGKGVTNHIAEVLASPYANKIDSNLIKELKDNTSMVAETGIIELKGEYDRDKTDGDKDTSNGKDDYLYGNDTNGNYTLNNVDFGLTERPKAGLELGKKVTHIRVTLANGNTLFDSSKGTTDLTWTQGKPYNLASTKSGDKYPEFYKQNHRYAFRNVKYGNKGSVNDIVSGAYDSTFNNGLIVVTMDEELMHGATIQISYELTVTNVGEIDYTGKDFYYKGAGASNNTKVTTAANTVLDYVSNNLKYRAEENNGNWSVINNPVSTAGLNSNIANGVSKIGTVLQTNKLGKALIPDKDKQKSTATVGLVLTQLITPDNNADDRTYDNMAEITTISNSVGRRMAYSIQGNQDPTADIPSEVDSVKAEQVVILPPFGSGNMIVYICLGVAVLAILSTGIILIKRKFKN